MCDLTPVLIGPDESTRTETPEDLLAREADTMPADDGSTGAPVTGDTGDGMSVVGDDTPVPVDIGGLLDRWVTQGGSYTLDDSERSAITQAVYDYGEKPPTELWRGESTDLTPKQVLARYKPGKAVDFEASSFSETFGSAAPYAESRSGGETEVIYRARGIASALNVSGRADQVAGFNEQEWIAAARQYVRRAYVDDEGHVVIEMNRTLPAGREDMLGKPTTNVAVDHAEEAAPALPPPGPAETPTGFTPVDAPGWSTLNPSEFADWLGYTPGTADIGEADLKAAADLLPEVRQQVKDAAAAVAEEHRAIFESAGYGDKGTIPYIFNAAERAKQGDTGTGLYDWFDSLRGEEKARLRGWMEHRTAAITEAENVTSARSGIDEISEGLAPYFGMPPGTDDTLVMERWLQETRIIDAAQAVANGRTINPDRYGGLDITSLIESRYDLRTLFLRKEAAAEDVAHVIAGQSVDQARDLLGYGDLGPKLGPAPWEMSQVEYVEEATRLEDVLAESHPIGTDEWGDPTYSPEANRAIDRMRELVPPGLDNPDSQLSFNELYREVIQVARTGGLV